MDKKVIEEYKNKNGGLNFTLKEMHLYQIARFDKFEEEMREKFDKVIDKIGSRVPYKVFFPIMGAFLSSVGYLFWLYTTLPKV